MSPPGDRRGDSRVWRFAAAVAIVAAGTFPTRAAATNADAAPRVAPTPTARAETRSQPSGHEDAEGLKLVPSTGDDHRSGGPCRKAAPVRRYDIAAINVDITLNQYLDHDPQGRMYVLESALKRVRAEEAANAAARRGRGSPAVSTGLAGDAIQPLTLRVLPGECVRVRLRNALSDGAAASLHVHGAGFVIGHSHRPAVAADPRAMALPGKAVDYEWMVGADEPEGTHVFHSHGDTRHQTSRGLFGALVVEPPGSKWIDPLTPARRATGWSAIVHDPQGHDFREFVLYYHEIGDENTQILDRSDQHVPLVDPLTHSYRPGARDLNYRSEPFMNRLQLQQARAGMFDESLEYSSYAFGDPATPIMRSYLGDPVKQRVVHGGSEVFHVHHVHGGAIRWRRQPGVEASAFDAGLDKHPAARGRSERTDSQSLGPSETFDVTDECGSGGCQQSVGDFLYHCHVAHHYFAGMWGIWRVYNTLQDGKTSTDALAPLPELPDRAARTQPGVTSAALVGSTVTWAGKPRAIAADDLAAVVERQLPPPGQPNGYDASVLDWQRQGDVYLGEPETTDKWPAYQARAPGSRSPLLFDPKTGKLAYPFLRPHLFKRPPFAPGHNPAPYLDPDHEGSALPVPGANGPASVCPKETRARSFAINAINVPITYNAKANLVDGGGKLFVLRSQQDAVRRDNSHREPLTIRANAGEDCVDVLLRSELVDDADTPFSKVSLHIHFVQFDVQGSDGVDTGFNYEQSVRPFRAEGEPVVRAAPPAATSVRLRGTSRFQPGIDVGIGLDQDATFEVRRVVAISGADIVLDRPLEFAHTAGEIVSTEFVRHRYFPDAQFGTSYFHDHVNGIATWQHGLIGALVAEPAGSSYTDPHTGEELLSGAVADIHTSAPVSAEV
jgi:FtsP/CotA-like multicopper oxidase with cupredoxin domain